MVSQNTGGPIVMRFISISQVQFAQFVQCFPNINFNFWTSICVFLIQIMYFLCRKCRNSLWNCIIFHHSWVVWQWCWLYFDLPCIRRTSYNSGSQQMLYGTYIVHVSRRRRCWTLSLPPPDNNFLWSLECNWRSCDFSFLSTVAKWEIVYRWFFFVSYTLDLRFASIDEGIWS